MSLPEDEAFLEDEDEDSDFKAGSDEGDDDSDEEGSEEGAGGAVEAKGARKGGKAPKKGAAKKDKTKRKRGNRMVEEEADEVRVGWARRMRLDAAARAQAWPCRSGALCTGGLYTHARAS
jgi:hypothetical protein